MKIMNLIEISAHQQQFTLILTILFAVTTCVSGGDDFSFQLGFLDTLLGDTLYQQYNKHAATMMTNCKDMQRESKFCQGWKAYGACKVHRTWMRRYCAKTCNLCAPPAPPLPVLPACASSTHGCCWDNKTAAQGPVIDGLTDLHATQCDPCMDRQSPTFCNMFKDACLNLRKGQGEFMRSRCAGTCGTPCAYNLNVHKKVCADDKAYRQACLEWFVEGKCQTNKETMRVLCPNSCGFCRQTVSYNVDV